MRSSSFVELLPFWRRGSGGRRHLSPHRFLRRGVGQSLLRLAQGLTAGDGQRRRPAVVGVEAQVVLGHGPGAQRGGRGGGAVPVGVSVVVRSVRPAALRGLGMIHRSGLPSSAGIVPLRQAVLPVELGGFLLPGGIHLCWRVAPSWESLMVLVVKVLGRPVHWIKS